MFFHPSSPHPSPKPSLDPAQAPRLRRLEWLLPLALGLGFVLTGVRATPFAHSPLALGGIAVLYGELALLLFFAARFAVRAGTVPGVAACLGLALAPAAQLRMDAELLQRWPMFALFVVALAGLAFGLLRLCAPRARQAAPRLLYQAYGALFALLASTLVGAHASAELRWHLFAHHRLFGTPLYWFDAPPLLSARDGLWTRQGRLAQPAEEEAVRFQGAPVLFARPPHIVFLMLDTLRADALAPYGGAANVMPAMNELAQHSVVFADVHSNASWTRASCASIFTGLLPEEHGAARFHEKLSESWVTLPEQLAAAGYQTAAFVANWVQVGYDTGFAQGFAREDFNELMSGQQILDQAGEGADANEVRGAYARAASVNKAALEWLGSEARDPYKPLFLYLHYLDPHSPYLEPPEPGTLSDPEERKRGLYRQQLRYLDRQLAQLFAELDEALAGPKVIVLTSDHGEEFFEHDDWGHGHSLYKELLHVPLFVHLPSGRAQRVEHALESRDLYMLVQDLAADPALDFEAWGAAHARSVRYSSQYLDRVEDARPDKKWTGLRRVEKGGLSLIWSAFGPSWQLYDERTDPGELDNRIDRDPARAAELRAELEAAVRFWSAPSEVTRTPEENEFLRALGYVGGVDESPPKKREP